MFIDRVLSYYIECALWTSTDDNGEPLDSVYTRDDLSEDCLTAMRSDVADFLECNADLLEKSGLPTWSIGHDFWLTRNRHGAGFWDRGLGDIGRQLTETSRPYGECWLYVGDDGLIYCQ